MSVPVLQSYAKATWRPGEKTSRDLGFGWVLVVQPDGQWHVVMV